MKKTIFIFSLMSLFALTNLGQTLDAQLKKPCSANFLQASIRGFTLGMEKETIEQDFPDLKWQNNKDSSESARKVVFKDKSRFEGLKSIEFKVYDGVLYEMIAVYEDKDHINIGVYAKAISKNWNIKEKWFGTGLIMLTGCKQRFTTLSATIDTKVLLLSDSIISERIRKEEEKKRKPIIP